MKSVPRNAPCPCGSGRKHKLCCGTTRDQERRARAVVERLITLPVDFPQLRASSKSFDRWADALADPTPTRALIEEGVARLGRREHKRLVQAVECALPEAGAAVGLFLAGAVSAALSERHRPDPYALDLLEADPELCADPAEVLSIALEPGDVWSLLDSGEADEGLAATEARRLATRGHRKRLARLVKRLAAFESCACHPRAWEAIAAACAAFERDRQVRERILELLLTDSLERLWELPALRAA